MRCQAGLMTAKELWMLTFRLDADLQDDVHVIEKRFMDKYYEGLRYRLRYPQFPEKGYVFQKFTAQSFYHRLMMAMGVDVIYHMRTAVVMKQAPSLRDLEQFKEVNLFLRGIVPSSATSLQW